MKWIWQQALKHEFTVVCVFYNPLYFGSQLQFWHQINSDVEKMYLQFENKEI